jgi:hypothetical protein
MAEKSLKLLNKNGWFLAYYTTYTTATITTIATVAAATTTTEGSQ